MFDREEFRLLIPYAGQSIAFALVPFPKRFFCILPTGLLQPIAEPCLSTDLLIEGPWSDFARYLLGNPKALQVTGNLELAQSCQQVFSNLDHDLGIWLDRLFGNTASNILTPPLKTITQKVKSRFQTIQQDLSEYVQYESDMLPPAYLVEEYLLEVDKLVHWGERLEARIIQLEKKLKIYPYPSGFRVGIKPQATGLVGSVHEDCEVGEDNTPDNLMGTGIDEKR